MPEEVCVPMPLQTVIDDVGWWSGRDGSRRNEPYRTGIERDHVVADYAAIARLRERLGMRPRDQVLAHLDAYARLLRDNDLGDFPTSFVPAAFRYCYGDGEAGLAPILREWGIRFISTPFASMHRRSNGDISLMSIDRGAVTVDRGTDPRIPWDTIAALPGDGIPGPILGLHWPNLLHPDPERNDLVVDRWADFLLSFGRRFDRILSPDTGTFQTQLAYHLGTRMEIRREGLRLDFSALKPLLPALHSDIFTIRLAESYELDFTRSELDLISSSTDPKSGERTLTLKTAPALRSAFIPFYRETS